MKLVSNIKDYYDGAIHQFGHSSDVLYNRLNSVHIFENDFPKEFKNLDKYNNNLNVVIGFCGKIYHAHFAIDPLRKKLTYYPYSNKDVKIVKGS